MRYLLDTNILLRLAVAEDPLHPRVLDTVRSLEADGHELCCSTQALREFWHVCTRPKSANGIGKELDEVGRMLDALAARLTVLLEDESTYSHWVALVRKLEVKGAACHDANHVAIALSHKVLTILTLDVSDFRRFSLVGIKAVDPSE